MGKLAEKIRKIFLISARSDELNFFGKMKIRPIGLRLKFFFEIFLPVLSFLILTSRQGVVGIYTTSPNGQIFTFTSPISASHISNFAKLAAPRKKISILDRSDEFLFFQKVQFLRSS